MKLRSLIFGLALPLLNKGCTYTTAVSQTNVPVDRTKVVQASVEKNIVFGFNFDNDFSLQLIEKLKQSCPGGEIRGVTTHDKVTLYFLFIFWKRHVEAQGYCVPQRKAHASIEPSWDDFSSYAKDDTP